MKRTILITACLFLSLGVRCQQVIDLYQGHIPGERASSVQEKITAGLISGVTHPTLEIYLPEKAKANGTGVIICPGGGYGVLAYEGEGIKTAKEFARNGITAFVLKYRLPDDATMENKAIGPLQDAQQAIKTVRENARQWNIATDRIGIMGFSAGGHLAATAATHYKKSLIENAGNTNLRPDFLILIYPVITIQDTLTHPESRTNLLGSSPSKETIEWFSNELQVTQDTPPTYLTHTGDDQVVDVDNSIHFYEALRHHKVPAEMHIYPEGNHGFVLKLPTDEWMKPLLQWMSKSKLLP